MKFELGSWRKLYVTESVEHRLLSVWTRSLRDYLLRHAEQNGTLLRDTKSPAVDLGKVLNVAPGERRQFAASISDLLRIGYLSHVHGRLWITKFEEAQTARSAGAVRQANYLARRNARTACDVTPNVTSDVSGDVTDDVTKDETRRDETTVPQTPGGGEDIWTSERERPIPFGLVTKAEELGVLRELAEHTGSDISSVKRAAEEFAGYWTIGAGMGKRRRNWMGRLRERIRELHGQGKLEMLQTSEVPKDSVNSAEGFV